MKTYVLSFFLFFTILITVNTNAQYGRNYGLDRSIDAHNRYSTPKKNKPYDFVKESTEKITKELSLDGFQEAVIKTLFEDYKNAVTAISEEQIPDQAKYEKMQIEMDKLDKKIEENLNKSQKLKFADFKKKGSKNKKSKKEETEPQIKKDSLQD